MRDLPTTQGGEVTRKWMYRGWLSAATKKLNDFAEGVSGMHAQ